KFPELKFKSTNARKVGSDKWLLNGELTIRGTTRPVELELEYGGRIKDPYGGERSGFSGRASINRKDFGLTWNQLLEAGGVAVSDKVEIHVEVELKRALAKAVAA